jgi:hypothetical protein
MIGIVVGLGILVLILGIATLFLPSLARVINFPGNEKIKATVVIIVGIILIVYGYISG